MALVRERKPHPEGFATELELVKALLTLAGIEFEDGRDRSGNPYWLSPPDLSSGPHWHILFTANSVTTAWVIGRPCEACTASQRQNGEQCRLPRSEWWNCAPTASHTPEYV
jgi:hypothetical protein